MFRKIAISSVAALGLLAAVVAPTQAYPHHLYHPHPVHPAHYRPYQHREFCSWAEANAWMCLQRQHGLSCYVEWHGPHCWVFYR